MKKRTKAGMTDEYRDGDGEDPRFDRHDGGKGQAGRKARQLCGQVRDALTLALSGCRDEVLQSLYVAEVHPGHPLRVLVRTPADGSIPRSVAVERLALAGGHLRTEVAAAVSRRYAPVLVFDVA